MEIYREVVDVHLIEDFVPEEVALAITNMKGVNFALNDQYHNAGASAGKGKFRVLLVEFVVEFKEGFVHEYFHHFIEISSLIE